MDGFEDDLDQARRLRGRSLRGLSQLRIGARGDLELDPHDGLVPPSLVQGKELAEQVGGRLQPAFGAESFTVEIGEQGLRASEDAIAEPIGDCLERKGHHLLARTEEVTHGTDREPCTVGDIGQRDVREAPVAEHREQRVSDHFATVLGINDLWHGSLYSMNVLALFSMNTLTQFWPLLIVVPLVVLVVRRIRGEPLDLKDAMVTPIVLLAIGTHMIIQVAPTAIDLAWLAGLSVISLAFGVARSVTIVIERRGDEFVQRYQWTTFALLLTSLAVGAVLGLLAQHFGMHEEARPLTFTIGLGLGGEGAVTLIRAAQRGIEMPWKTLGHELRDRVVDRS